MFRPTLGNSGDDGVKWLWCWRCQADMPMLDENEFAEVSAVPTECMTNAKRLREAHGASLDEDPIDRIFAPARAKYEELTGMADCHQNAIHHHRISLYGPPCESCGKVLRTPTASGCWECGTERAPGPWINQRHVPLESTPVYHERIDLGLLVDLLRAMPRDRLAQALAQALTDEKCAATACTGPIPLDDARQLYEIRQKIEAIQRKKTGQVQAEGYEQLLENLVSTDEEAVVIHLIEIESHDFIVFTARDSARVLGVLRSRKPR